MSGREVYSAHNAFLQGSILLSMLGSGCGGGSGFTSQGSGQDASVSGESEGGVVIVVNPNADAQGPFDALAESTPAIPTTEADAGEPRKQGDATVDGPSCSSSDLECGGTCVAIDTDNCGACGTKCSAPDGGTPTCTEVNHAYKCDIACSPNLTHCGNACVSVQTDTNNCGRCGHGCLAGACVSGQCQSWLVANTSATNAGLYVPRAGAFGWAQMVTDGTHVLWMDVNQGILEVSAKAGPSAPIGNLSPLHGSNSSSGPANLAMANGVVVWTMMDANNGISLWAASEGQYPSGAMVASLGPNSVGDLPSGLALDATAANAYFIDSENNSAPSPQYPGLYKCNLANKSCSVLYAVTVPTTLLLANDVAMAGSRLFWTDSANGSISRADYASNALGTVVSNQNAPCLLTLDATNLYWDSVVLSDAGPPSFSLAATPQASPGAVTSLVSSTSGSLGGMASDGTNLYFIENTSSAIGQLEYVPVSGSSAPQPLKPNQQAYALAVGGGAIYWLNSGDNTIDGIAAP
jgi:hypothetical protein